MTATPNADDLRELLVSDLLRAAKIHSPRVAEANVGRPTSVRMASVNSTACSFTKKSTDASDAHNAALAAREEYLFPSDSESKNDMTW